METPSHIPGQVPLVARSVALRVVTPDDYPFLFKLALDPDVAYRWRYRGVTPSFQGFVDGLFDSVLCQFVVWKHAERVGHIVAYNADLSNGTVYCGVVVHPGAAGGLVSPGVVATFLFTNYLFHNWNFRKIYFDSMGLSIEDFGSAVDRALELEGILKDHHFYSGQWWHRYFLTLNHDRWKDYVVPTVARLAKC